MGKRQIVLPDFGVKYWYVGVKSDFKTFEAMEACWGDMLLDRRRYASGNFYLDFKAAYEIANHQNDIMMQMPPQTRRPS